MAPKKEPVEIAATLEVLDDAPGVLDDDAPRPPKVDLSPEQIAALQAEKAEILAQLQARLPAPQATRTVALPSVSDEPVVIQTTPALEAANAALAQIDAEVAALDQAQKAIEREHAETLKAAAEAHKARLDELRRKRDAAQAAATRQRQAQAAIELAARAKVAAQEAERERQREAADEAERAAQIAARVTPVLERARVVQAELEELARHHAPTLEKLAAMTWKDTPSTWPGAWRVEFERNIVIVADKRLRELKSFLNQYVRLIRAAEEILDAGSNVHPQHVNQTLHELMLGDESPRYIREELAALNETLASIHECGAHTARPDQPETIRDGLPNEDRLKTKDRLLQAGQYRALQNYADGMDNDPVA